jgi:hypothetical protein
VEYGLGVPPHFFIPHRFVIPAGGRNLLVASRTGAARNLQIPRRLRRFRMTKVHDGAGQPPSTPVAPDACYLSSNIPNLLNPNSFKQPATYSEV